MRTGSFNREQMERSRSFFEDHLARGVFERVTLLQRHLAAVRSLGDESPTSLRTLDSLHLAIASDLRAKMATFDRRLAEASRAMGMGVVP